MKKTKNGSYRIGRFEIFPYVGRKLWGWGGFNIGRTRVLKIGFARIFINQANP